MGVFGLGLGRVVLGLFFVFLHWWGVGKGDCILFLLGFLSSSDDALMAIENSLLPLLTTLTSLFFFFSSCRV